MLKDNPNINLYLNESFDKIDTKKIFNPKYYLENERTLISNLVLNMLKKNTLKILVIEQF